MPSKKKNKAATGGNFAEAYAKAMAAPRVDPPTAAALKSKDKPKEVE